ncbi:EAL domain-containing protein [Bacillus sp. BRMEA1]|uniref:sensor domain-containing protein n=1 Tax=Neobacillus endophyticus TaxID=2738405 RepID=UPI0015651110|nr:EAL domain-containing protein [Neobacillus endophyticus]NRD76914.1 EAL domain-containing protein [Neobacillus endophyticus]
MKKSLIKQNYFKLFSKRWIAILLLYFIPAVLDLVDPFDLLFHNIFWFFYLIPTLIMTFSFGTQYGFIATGIGSTILFIIESIQRDDLIHEEFIAFVELTIVNILITVVVGLLVKRINEKQAQLNETKNLLESIFNHLDIGIWSLKEGQSFLKSKGIEKIYQMPREYMISNKNFWREAIHPDDLFITNVIGEKIKQQKDYEYEYRIIRPSGEVRWMRDRGVPVFDENGTLIRYDGTNVDITRQKELEFQLRESEEKYKSLLENMLVGVFLIQNSELVYVNNWLTNILGLTEENLLGTNFFDYIMDEEKQHLISEFKKLIDGETAFLVEKIQLKSKSGSSIYLELQSVLTTTNGSPGIIGIALDVTDELKVKAEIEHIAYHDSLTDLFNMNYLTHQLTHEFMLNKENHIPSCLMFFNLDRFKLINESFGHQIGDQVLKMVAEKLQNLTQPEARIIRAGGDEFILYLPYINSDQAKSQAEVILQEFSKPIYLEEMDVRLSARMGITVVQEEDLIEDAIRKASSALHFLKEDGRNRYQFYSEEFVKKANRKLLIEQGLRRALEEELLEVFYQPKLDLNTNQITGMEALLRWSDPILGWVSPAEFIPIAEETGLINPIGKRVLEEACRQNFEWNQLGYTSMHVCVNISSKQFIQDDFVHMIELILLETGLKPECLNLEITEGIALYNIKETINKLLELKELGVSVSLDDFGTGYSSLSYIKSLPINFLKIDRSFITDIFSNHQDAAIINAIISLAHSLDFKVVAEGVETEQQLELLAKMGCDEIQGYYIAKPMAPADFKTFLCNNIIKTFV